MDSMMFVKFACGLGEPTHIVSPWRGWSVWV